MKLDDNQYKASAALAALGVVYGDIGTSPLYALKESFHHSHNLFVTNSSVFGILSLIFWSLIIVVSIKYLVFVIRADNQGEGGVLAITALLGTLKLKSGKLLQRLTVIGLFGTALLYGDGIITPAISVLSAVEGLEFVTPALNPYIIPITILILIALFSIQRHGTAVVGKVFGPITLTWFIVIGILGLYQVIQSPSILAAINPYYALDFFNVHGLKGFTVLGSVFLVVTGGEALYSDLGHFGKAPIRHAWFVIVLPSLILCYFGQGALLLKNPEGIKNPFYLLAPEWGVLPLVCLATVSACIASQALITGLFSLTMQAVQLHYIPRITISHTSEKEFGQIYVKTVNFLLMICCIALVVTFKSSSNLAAAYGIAVTTTMVITTILFYFVARHSWNWHPVVAGGLCGFFLLIEGSFFGANLLKILHGGWLPLIIGAVLFMFMTTWSRGRKILSERMKSYTVPLNDFLNNIKETKPVRVSGVAIYMSGHPESVPTTLFQSFKHFNCLHDHIALLYVNTADIPHIPPSNRVKLQNIAPHMYKITVTYGFMDMPNVPNELSGIILDQGLVLDPMQATYFLGRERIIATKNKGMALWRERVFAILSRNAQPATHFFQLPEARVVEIGSVIGI